MNPIGDQGGPRKRSTPMYGQDSGAEMSEEARNEAAPDSLEQFEEQAEQTIQILKEINPYFWRLHGEELDKLKQELMEAAAEAAEGPKQRKPAAAEPEEDS